MRTIIAILGAFCALAILATSPASAQKYPTQTIKIVVPFPAGGAADLLARSIAQKMGESLNQSIIIENRAGVAGSVGAAVVSHATGDGYTLGLGTLSTLVLNPTLSRAPLYDPRKDFVYIAMLTELPILMAMPAELPAKDLAGLIDYAKNNPAKMNYSSNGVGSSGHILGEMIKRKFEIQATHVPYGGDVPIINALMGQQVQLGLLAIPAAAEFIKSGKIKAPAMTGTKRSPIIPDVPTIVELGYPDLTSSTWFSIVAPAGTPADIVALLNREVNKAMATPEVKQVFKGAGLDPTPMELAAFQSFVASEQDKWGAAIKALDLHID